MTQNELQAFLKHQATIRARFAAALAEGRTVETTYTNSGKAVVTLSNIPKRQRGRCGALCRTGEPCKMRKVPGKRRCRLHGGLSTGPKTPEGRLRVAISNRKRSKDPEALRRGQLVVMEYARRENEGISLLAPLPSLAELEATYGDQIPAFSTT